MICQLVGNILHGVMHFFLIFLSAILSEEEDLL